MRVIRVYSWNRSTGKKTMVRIEINSDKGIWNIWKTLAELMRKQTRQDIFDLGQPSVIVDSGLEDRMACQDGIWRSWDIEKDESRWGRTAMFSPESPLADQEIYLAVEMYPYGYVLELKHRETNQICYYSSHHIRRIKINEEKSRAQVWISPHYMFSWLQRNQDIIEFFVDSGWSIQVRPHNSLAYREDMEKLANIRPVTLLSKQKEFMNMISLLEEVGASSQISYEDMQVPLHAETNNWESEIHEEIIYRMKMLKLSETVINDYSKNRRVYMSEFYGYPSECSQKAMIYAKRIESIGLIPYHIIRSHLATGMGETYYILYASQNPSCWEAERPNKQDSIPAWAFGNSIKEMSVHTVSFNGGLLILR